MRARPRLTGNTQLSKHIVDLTGREPMHARRGSLIFFSCADAYFGFVDLPISARFRYFKIYASFYYYKIKKKIEKFRVPDRGNEHDA